jgi:hypothetical protein
LKGGADTYAYALGDPISKMDPTGLATSVTVRCGPVLSGAVHCQVIATCSKTGETQSFQIGGPAGANDWQKLWSGLIPPKADPNSIQPKLPAANQTDYSASCHGDDCGCKALKCLKTAFQNAQPPPYYALWQNSNTFAHSLLSQCSCSIDPYVTTALPGIGPVYATSPRSAQGW